MLIFTVLKFKFFFWPSGLTETTTDFVIYSFKAWPLS